MIRVRELSVNYGPLRALSSISIDVMKGETVAVVGPSGSGKTTLIKALAGLINYKGVIEIGGEQVKCPRKDVAVIFQENNLLPWYTVRQNVQLALKFNNPNNANPKKVDEILAHVGLKDFSNYYPSQLSGGMKQRAALARALVIEPQVLLLDEPFSALDALTREQMQDIVMKMWSQLRFTMLIVTHNIEEAVYMGKTIYVFTERPGRIKAVIQNKGTGTNEYRDTDEYYKVVKHVRQIINQ
ncbi:MAG: ABC transporter ATP-binding protein [Thermoprotei archaeon]